LVVWFQLGEFLLFSVGDNSDRGRGRPLAILDGDGAFMFFEMRKG